MIIAILIATVAMAFLLVAILRKRTKPVFVILTIVSLLAFGGLFLFYIFLKSLAPAQVTVTEEYVSSNRALSNGVTIEKLQVDSIGRENYPVKYTVTYITTCSIDYQQVKSKSPPKKIAFSESGKYWWTEEYVNMHFVHSGIKRTTTDSTRRYQRSMGTQKFATCPMKFEKEQWYFVTLGDPQITGIFFFIDNEGEVHQYIIGSGVSPI